MNREIQYIMTNEKLVNEALREALAERNASVAVDVFIEKLGISLGCDRFYIFEGVRGVPVNNTFEWCAQGVSAEKDFLQNVPFEAVEWWYDIFENYNHMIIENVEDLKETEPLTYEYLKPQNINSLVASPLKKGDDILGFFGVDNPPENSLHSITYIVEIVSHFIVSLLEKKSLWDKMEKLSYEDNLTGVYNRHALNECIENRKYFTNTGIVYCDVLGLKQINDTLGHQAGDELLCRASKILYSVFRKKDIYRVGGDEFMIISCGIEQGLFMKKVDILREKMKEEKALMSLGAIWKPLISNMDQAMAEADYIMYEEKKSFYALKKNEE